MSSPPPPGTLNVVSNSPPAPAIGSPAAPGTEPEAARLVAEESARLGIDVHVIDDPAAHHRAARVLQDIWAHADGAPLTSELLRALAHAGNYVAAAFDRGEMVAVATAFRTGHGSLHSHIAGVLPPYQGRSVGYLLKMHQRLWALREGIDTISWTFDPLVRRNAHFNLVKLGARVADYLPDFYGAMTDGINGGVPSDRLLADWHLADPATGDIVTPGSDAVIALDEQIDGEPTARAVDDRTGRDRIIVVPADVDRLREQDPQCAVRWRFALRDAMLSAQRDGHRIAGLTADGAYLTRRSGTPGVRRGGSTR